MDMDFVGAFELEYGKMVDFSRIIISKIAKVRTPVEFRLVMFTIYAMHILTGGVYHLFHQNDTSSLTFTLFVRGKGIVSRIYPAHFMGV